MPLDKRPREKMIKYGSNSLTTEELVALIIRTGSKKETAIDLANNLLNQTNGLKGIIDFTPEEFMKYRGIGKAKGTQLCAVIELSKRISSCKFQGKVVLNSPKDAASFLMPMMRYLRQEHLYAVLLDVKNKVIAKTLISKGGLSSSTVHPREVFKKAIKKSCASIIIAHNHPSGDPTPSDNDIEVTNRLFSAGEVLGIEVMDHIIIGDDKYISLKAKKLF
ncbi:MAG TPA: DNA repair protein RadC [Halanaerobiales bacterium]|nr:DNA repair protein RadC [Halanaerobiales bacterium]